MAKIIKNNLGNFLVTLLIFLLATGLMYSLIPPEIQEVEAATEDLHADGAGTSNTYTGVTQANLATNDNDTTKATSTTKANFLYATIANTSTCSGTVTSVTAKIYAYSGATGQTQAIGMYDGTTIIYGAQEQPSINSAAYSYHEYTSTTNPSGGAWTCAGVDSLEIVIDPNKSGAPTGDWRVTELWITVNYTPPAVPSITIISGGGVVSYGLVENNAFQNTTSSGVDNTQIVQNNGTVPENFLIKSSDATGGTFWNLSAGQALDNFTHTASIDGGGNWNIYMTESDNYVYLKTNVENGTNVNVDLQIGMPTDMTDYLIHNITVTIMAEIQ